MSTTLTNLIPDLYNALDVVSRELVGFIPAVTLDASSERAAVGQTIRSPVAPVAAAGDITPGVNPPNDGNQTIGNTTLTISKARRVPIRWTGEQERAANTGPGAQAIRVNQIAQAIRALVNEIEVDLAALHVNASRATGAANATPFATAGDFRDASRVAQILDDNGAPVSDRHLILDSAATVNMRGLQSRADVQGEISLLRQGILLDHSGFSIRQSGLVRTHTAGTGASATTNNAGYAVGATVITLASAGSGTILAGDVITFAGDTNQYVVASGDTDVSNGGTITLAAPGLMRAIPASATNITVVATSRRAMGFSRDALVLVTRAPALPEGGDLATDRTVITDPRSGIAIEVAMYPQYRQMQWEFSVCWGVAVPNPRHLALLLGQP